MSRFSRINTIWRKELIDTLRDRRTVIAMVLVPMVLYPALMLGSIQAIELQISNLVREEYHVAVRSEAQQVWLARFIDTDPVRRQMLGEAASRPSVDAPAEPAAEEEPSAPRRGRGAESARAGVRVMPPPYKVFVVPDVVRAVADGVVHCGLLIEGDPPGPDAAASTVMRLVYDESDIRSEIAATGLGGIIERANELAVAQRLKRFSLSPDFIRPLALVQQNVATPEKMAGSILGQIVPLILIMMTITGAIYPAIDLTAGERERGTLETLMVAPVPTADLIAGKFIVVTLIGMLSAVLNLLSIGGTVYLGGMGEILTRGSEFVFPLSALPWILLMLIPLAVLFSALLLAVCSFARSFKEAQNYIMPVMIGAMIPGVVGVLPGTRFEGPIAVVPVANVVVLTRELFMGRFNLEAILWVMLSTSLFAAAAVAIAARLFGQEAVLFADSASLKTVFQRRFFKPRATPGAAQALLIVALVYTLNFYLQQSLVRPGVSQGKQFFGLLAAVLVLLFIVAPLAATVYMRADVRTTLRLGRPSAAGLVAGLCLGLSTWVLARQWFLLQQRWLPLDPQTLHALQEQFAWLDRQPAVVVVAFMAVLPAVAEEVFFRGYVLSGLRSSLGRIASIAIVAVAFGLFHYSAHRLAATTMLGLLLGLLVVQSGSIWPAILAHAMHNALTILSTRPDGLLPLLERFAFPSDENAALPAAWLWCAAATCAIGVLLSLAGGAGRGADDRSRNARSRPADRLAELVD